MLATWPFSVIETLIGDILIRFIKKIRDTYFEIYKAIYVAILENILTPEELEQKMKM